MTSLQNLFVAKLPRNITDSDLHELFAAYNPTSAKIMLDAATGKSKGFGFVLFASEEEGKRAYEALNKMHATVHGHAFSLCIFPSKHDGKVATEESTALYIRNIPRTLGLPEVEEFLKQFGNLTYCAMREDHYGGPVWVVYGEYETVEESREALTKLHGSKHYFDYPVAILAKYADTEEAKKERRKRREQQQQHGCESVNPGHHHSRGHPGEKGGNGGHHGGKGDATFFQDNTTNNAHNNNNNNNTGNANNFYGANTTTNNSAGNANNNNNSSGGPKSKGAGGPYNRNVENFPDEATAEMGAVPNSNNNTNNNGYGANLGNRMDFNTHAMNHNFNSPPGAGTYSGVFAPQNHFAPAQVNPNMYYDPQFNSQVPIGPYAPVGSYAPPHARDAAASGFGGLTGSPSPLANGTSPGAPVNSSQYAVNNPTSIPSTNSAPYNLEASPNGGSVNLANTGISTFLNVAFPTTAGSGSGFDPSSNGRGTPLEGSFELDGGSTGRDTQQGGNSAAAHLYAPRSPHRRTSSLMSGSLTYRHNPYAPVTPASSCSSQEGSPRVGPYVEPAVIPNVTVSQAQPRSPLRVAAQVGASSSHFSGTHFANGNNSSTGTFPTANNESGHYAHLTNEAVNASGTSSPQASEGNSTGNTGAVPTPAFVCNHFASNSFGKGSSAS